MKLKRADLSIFIALAAIAGLFLIYFLYTSPPTSEASHLAPAFDWAWSSNVGWISFNCSNGNTCPPNGTSNYKVYTDHLSASEVQLRGYAWSSNVGWVSFEPTAGCPGVVTCDARISGSELTGWAKVLSTGEWLSLNCSNMGPCGTPMNADYKVSYDSVTGNLSGWAWGSGVVGWVSFSCLDTGSCTPSSQYQVRIVPVEEESCQEIGAPNFGGPGPCQQPSIPPSGGGGGASTTKPIFKEKETVPR